MWECVDKSGTMTKEYINFTKPLNKDQGTLLKCHARILTKRKTKKCSSEENACGTFTVENEIGFAIPLSII